jgi:hypothetical protein
MPSSFILINAPRTVPTTAAGLSTAIVNAKPGDVLVIEEAGDPITLNLNNRQKAGYGVCVQLPIDQKLRVSMSGGTSNIHFFGGNFSADEVTGNTDLANYGLDIASGCSKISVQGSYFGQNASAIRVNSASDISITKSRFTISRADHAQTPTTSRMEMSENNFDSGAKGVKLCYFNDGRTPTENISSSNCSVAGGTWEDTSHNDVWQFRTGCADIIAKNNVVNAYLAAGFVTFGTAGPQPLQRCLVQGNVINDSDANAINVSGNHVEISGNTVPASPDATVAPRITLVRSTDGFVRGGQNTAPAFTNPSGVDLASGTINGDAVDSPEPPRIVLPPWAPIVTTPSAIEAAVPTYILGGGIRPSSPSPSVGTWLTLNRGLWKDVAGVSWEYRWRRDGTPISGATSQIYQVVADDVGTSLDVQCRGINPQGTGDWYTYTARTPA